MSLRNAHVVTAIMTAVLASLPANATWSIVLADTETGEVGIGQATCVGNIDLRSESAVVVSGRGVGTVQAYVDVSGLARSTIRSGLLAGTPPGQILADLSANDPAHETHQYCIVDVQGGAATYTGTMVQSFAYAGGQTGQAGSIRYCVAGNVLAGGPVIAQAAQAIADTPGGLADKLMAAMQAARGMGGDGRCSCSYSAPDSCGSPPLAFDLTALNGYLVVARTGDTPACSICSGGDYYLDLNVAFEDGIDPVPPIPWLQDLYDDFLVDMQHLPDAVESVVTFDPPALIPDGNSTTLMHVELLDLDGAPIGVPITSFTVEHAPSGDGVSTIGSSVDDGGGVYSVTITAGTVAGVDRFGVTADDGQRPVVLMPAPRLPVGMPGEVENLRWSSVATMEWDAALAAASYHVYRGDLAVLDCGYFGECRDDLDPDPTDLTLTDPSAPSPGAAWFYLVTSVDGGGNEGAVGPSACGLRENAASCP